MKLLGPGLAALLFLMIGFACLFWPENVRQFVLDATNDSPSLFFMKWRIYIWFLRFFGFITVLACAAILLLISQLD